MEESVPYVLIIDDAPENINLLSSIFKDLIKVKVALSSEKALEILSKGHLPSLILLDIVLPGMDGFQLLHHLKRSESYKKVPVYLVSNIVNAQNIQKGVALGANGFLSKPVSITELGNLIKKYFNIKIL